MKKTKSVMSVLFGAVFFLLASLSLLLCLGCDEDEDEDLSIGEITVINIPVNIPVFNNTATANAAFKIYINASDSQSEDAPSVAKGVAKFSQSTSNNGTYSIKIKLQKPSKTVNGEPGDPNEDTGSWSGTAKYFSIMICPISVATDGINAVWIKGGYTLDSGKKECDWKKLMDFRVTGTDSLGLLQKSQVLYESIILKDSDITK
jgi:hypothetical protein